MKTAINDSTSEYSMSFKEPESSWVNTSNSEAKKIKEKAQQQKPKKKKRKGGCK